MFYWTDGEDGDLFRLFCRLFIEFVDHIIRTSWVSTNQFETTALGH